MSPGTVRAFRALREQGVRTFIASGRPKVLIPDMPVSFDGYVTMNGGYCFVGEQVLLSNPIPQQETHSWLHYVEDNGLCTMLFTKNEMAINTLTKARMYTGMPMPAVALREIDGNCKIMRTFNFSDYKNRF